MKNIFAWLMGDKALDCDQSPGIKISIIMVYNIIKQFRSSRSYYDAMRLESLLGRINIKKHFSFAKIFPFLPITLKLLQYN